MNLIGSVYWLFNVYGCKKLHALKLMHMHNMCTHAFGT